MAEVLVVVGERCCIRLGVDLDCSPDYSLVVGLAEILAVDLLADNPAVGLAGGSEVDLADTPAVDPVDSSAVGLVDSSAGAPGYDPEGEMGRSSDYP